MKSFNERCYSILRRVPRGKVTTYKAIAQAMKSKAYRAVGNAMNRNPHSYAARGRVGGKSASKHDLVPCHRVICFDGSIGGFAHGTKKKIEMLRKEGVEIQNNRIDLKKYKYHLQTKLL